MGKVDAIDKRQELMDSYMKDLHSSMNSLTAAMTTLTKDVRGAKNVKRKINKTK